MGPDSLTWKMDGPPLEIIQLIKCDRPIRVEAKWEVMADLKPELFEQAPLHSCSRSVQTHLGWESVCCGTLAADVGRRWGKCCKPCNDGSRLGSFSVPVVVNCWQPWHRPNTRTHTHAHAKKQCHGVNTSVDRIVMQKDRQLTLQSPFMWAVMIKLIVLFLFVWKMKGGTHPLTSPTETHMSNSNGRWKGRSLTGDGRPRSRSVFPFSAHNDRSSLCKSQKGQSGINMCTQTLEPSCTRS